MADDLHYRITVDDVESVKAQDRTKKGFREIETTAERTALRANQSFDSMTKSVLRTAQALGAIALAKKGVDALIDSVTRFTHAQIQQNGVLATAATFYQGLRVALNPSVFTAGGFAIGIAADKTLDLVKNRAKLIEQEATLAGLASKFGRDVSPSAVLSSRSRESFGVQATAGRLLGQEIKIDPNELLAASRQAAAITDNYEKGRFALSRFGAEAEKVLPLLTDRTATAIERAQRLNRTLDPETSASLLRLKAALEGPKRELIALGDAFTYAKEKAKQFIAEGAAKAFGLVEALGGGARAGAQGRFGNVQGEFPTLDIKRPGAPGVPTQPGAADRAAALLFRDDVTKAGLQQQLSIAREREAKFLGEFTGATPGARDQAASQLLDVRARRVRLEGQVEAIEKAEEAAEKWRQTVESGFVRAAEIVREEAEEYKRLILTGWNAQGSGAIELRGRLRDAELQEGLKLSNLAVLQPFQQAQLNRIQGGARGSRDIELLRGGFFGNQSAQLEAERKSLEFQTKRIELLTGPGGEADAIERITALRLESLERQRLLGAESRDIDLERLRIGEDREIKLLEFGRKQVELARQQFEDIERRVDSLFNAMLGGARSFADALRRIMLTAVLTPVKQAFSSLIAGMLTGQRVATGGGFGGLLGSIGFGGLPGVSQAGALGGTSGFSGPVSFDSQSVGGGAGQLANLGSGGVGLGSKFGLGSGAGLGALGIGAAALGLQGAFKLGQGGTAGRIAGPAVGAVSGLLGFGALASMFPVLAAAGPFGLIAAGGIGAFVGLMGTFRKAAEDKAKEKIKAIYGIDISDKNILKQIVGMAKSGFGGNLDVAIRSPQIRDLIELYGMSTGQGTGPLSSRPMHTSFVSSGAQLTQLPAYFNGMPQPVSSAPAPQITVVVQNQLPGDKVGAYLRGEMVQTIVDSPREVQASVQTAHRFSMGRRQMAAQMFGSGLVIT